jgi:tetratricopeptide (TPR) repeat protein
LPEELSLFVIMFNAFRYRLFVISRAVFVGIWCVCFFASNSTLSGTSDEQRLLHLTLQKQRLFEMFAEGVDAFTEQQLVDRLHKLSEAFAEYAADFPNDVMGLILWARLLQVMEKDEAAMQLFLKADALDPEIAVVKQQIGNHLAETGEGINALSYLFRAVELEPMEAVYHYQLGELLHHFRDTYIDKGILTRANLDAAMQRAFRQAALLQTDEFDLQMRYGESYYDVESPDWERALNHWQALEVATTEVFREQIIALHLARVLLELNRPKEALKALEDIHHTALRASRDFLLERCAKAIALLPNE